jgi:hypothetical protein
MHVSGVHKKVKHYGDIRRSGHREVVVFFADQLLPWIPVDVSRVRAESLGAVTLLDKAEFGHELIPAILRLGDSGHQP